MTPTYGVWVNAERTVMLRVWSNGQVEVALREDSARIWGPPIRMVEESSPAR